MHYCKTEKTNFKGHLIRNESGFTLIELSIVIVLIGLIVAGVVGGRNLIEQAKLRSIISDVQTFDVAVNTFKLENNALPGDMGNASDYWTGIPDGNGNKKVATSDCSGNCHSGEYWWFWVHLGQLASGLLPNAFSSSGVPLNFTEADVAGLLPKSDTEHYWGVYSRSRWQGH